MKPLNATTARILDTLTDGLEIGEGRKIDNAPGAWMPLHVNRLTETTYSVSHYFEQNGDLVPDPDGVFWRSQIGTWHPVSLQQCTGHYTRALELDQNERPKAWWPAAYADLRSFVTVWMRNARDQQGIKPARKTA